MDAVVSLICVAGCALGMFLVAKLLMQEHRSHSHVLLAGAIGVACLGELFSAASHLSQVGVDAGSSLAGFPALLFAPLLFLYFRAQARGLRMRTTDAWHFCCFAMLQAVAVLDAGQQPLLDLACLLVLLTYALASLRIVCLEPMPAPVVELVALLMALASYLLGAAADVLLPAWDSRGDLADVVLSFAWAVLAYGELRRALRREPERDPQPVLREAETGPGKIKYGNNRLPDFARESIAVELQRHMQAAQPWLKVDLTLGELAAGINVSSHHLSQIINSEFGKSFACFINEYRVGEACQLLTGDNARSVLDVALDSGFSSKSSFNASFKKHTGMTPSEYRKTSQHRSCLVA